MQIAACDESFDPESFDPESFDPESFDPELTTEGLTTEGLTTERLTAEGLSRIECGINQLRISDFRFRIKKYKDQGERLRDL
jgi:hypothetical protein